MHGRRGEEPIRGASLQWRAGRTNAMGLAVSTRLAWEAGGGIYSGDARGRRCAAVWTGKGAGVSLSALAFGSPGLWRRDSALPAGPCRRCGRGGFDRDDAFWFWRRPWLWPKLPRHPRPLLALVRLLLSFPMDPSR